MLDGENKHHASLFPNVTDNPVIPNAVAPQPAKLMAQGPPETARVFLRRNARVHVVENFPLHRAVNRPQVSFSPRVVFNRPSQGFCATGWK